MDYCKTELSADDFSKLSEFIYSNYGIKMPPAKKTMLQARLQSRLRANNLNSFKEYCNFVFSGDNKDTEVIHMIDVVSTNKTDFFREPSHFDFMQTVVLPEFVSKNPQQELKVWSSACSSGEEAYTAAMVISNYSHTNQHLDYSIIGTDISTKVLEKGVKAIYPEEKINPIPYSYKTKFLMRNKNASVNDFRIVPEIRNKVRFFRINLMDNHYNVPAAFDIIFCRNVLIYFDRPTQEKVINKLCSHLKPGGYFFLGHSETISGFDTSLKQVKPTIYTKISH